MDLLALARESVKLYLELIISSCIQGMLAPFAVLLALITRMRKPASDSDNTTSKKILITGASSGIGESLAMEYASRGDSMVITGRNSARLEKVKEACLKAGAASVSSWQVEIQDKESMLKMIEEEWAKAPIDVIYANAGVNHKNAVSSEVDGLDRSWEIMNVNVNGTLHTIIPASRLMAKRGEGKVVMISSLKAHLTAGITPSYQASKAAQMILVEGFAETFRSRGLQLSIVTPGWVESRLFDAVKSDVPSFAPVWTSPKAARFIVSEVDAGMHVIGFPIHLEVFLVVARSLPPLVRLALNRVAKLGKAEDCFENICLPLEASSS